jgi:methionine sulfoxide reductase catalytic subunit
MDNKLKHVSVPSSEITPESVYLSRRDFMRVAGISGLGALMAACAPKLNAATPAVTTVPGLTDELGDAATGYDDITHYNNYYEFTVSKEGVAPMSENFTPHPWTVEVGGLVNKPQTFDVDDLITRFAPEDRIYRLRCVEAWSMVIPWQGFELNKILDLVEPTSAAKYVAFTTIFRPEEMKGQSSPFYPWPYTEGLRLDEARHRLAILATGLYGKPLPNQDGAPIRLVVPWKYGFKSIKAIVKIDLVEEQPPTLWNAVAPNEYGFYSNVNPEVDHPRWSQRTERRIGEFHRRPTLMFNGYEDEVADLYAGMDLKANF